VRIDCESIDLVRERDDVIDYVGSERKAIHPVVIGEPNGGTCVSCRGANSTSDSAVGFNDVAGDLRGSRHACGANEKDQAEKRRKKPMRHAMPVCPLSLWHSDHFSPPSGLLYVLLLFVRHVVCATF
jgi:hypothetical protein